MNILLGFMSTKMIFLYIDVETCSLCLQRKITAFRAGLEFSSLLFSFCRCVWVKLPKCAELDVLNARES